jgi:histidyl-tRNA synthetase
LELNSLGEAADRPAYKVKLVEFLKTREERLCGNCRRRLSVNPLRVLDCKVSGCREATQEVPRLTDHLSRGASEHFEAVKQGLQAFGIPFILNPRLVRGLDYYTMTAFEVTCEHLGAQNAVGAGGRYDGLVETLGGPATPAVGFAVGLERVSLTLPESAVQPRGCLVFVAGFGASGFPVAMRVVDALRQLGVPTDTDYRTSSLKGLLRQADRLGATHTLLVGDDEVAKGVLILRDMRTKAQQEVPIGAAPAAVARRILESP